MSEISELFEGGQGDGTLRSSLRMAKRAIDNDWPVRPEIRQLVITKAALVVGNSTDTRDTIAAMKVIVSADAVNVRRETNEIAREKNVIDERHNHIVEATAILRAAMASADVREQMAALSDKICAPELAEVPCHGP